MTGCATCGGYGGHHDPIAHDTDRPPQHCDCEGCREFRAVHARHCPEVPREQREAQRALDRDALNRHRAAAAGMWGAA